MLSSTSVSVQVNLSIISMVPAGGVVTGALLLPFPIHIPCHSNISVLLPVFPALPAAFAALSFIVIFADQIMALLHSCNQHLFRTFLYIVHLQPLLVLRAFLLCCAHRAGRAGCSAGDVLSR